MTHLSCFRHKAWRNILAFVVLTLLPLAAGGCAKDRSKEKSESPEALYKKGLSSLQRKRYSEAIAAFYKLKYDYPSDVAAVLADLKIADAYYLDKDYAQAAASYEDFRKFHPSSEHIPYVTYQLGMSYFNQRLSIDRDPTFLKKAMSEFQYLVTYFPQSPFAYPGYKKLLECQRLLAAHELYVANFYYKKAKYRAAIKRFEDSFRSYPAIPAKPGMLFILADAYLKVGELRKSHYVYSTIVKEYPESKFAKKAKKILATKLTEKKLMMTEKEARAREVIATAEAPPGPLLAAKGSSPPYEPSKEDISANRKEETRNGSRDTDTESGRKKAQKGEDRRLTEGTSAVAAAEKKNGLPKDSADDTVKAGKKSFFSKVLGVVAALNPFRKEEKEAEMPHEASSSGLQEGAVPKQAPQPRMLATKREKPRKVARALQGKPEMMVERPVGRSPKEEEKKTLMVDRPRPTETVPASTQRRSSKPSVLAFLSDLFSSINPFKRSEAPIEKHPSKEEALVASRIPQGPKRDLLVDSPASIAKGSKISKGSKATRPSVAKTEAPVDRHAQPEALPRPLKKPQEAAGPGAAQVAAFRRYLQQKRKAAEEDALLYASQKGHQAPPVAGVGKAPRSSKGDIFSPSRPPIEEIDEEARPIFLARIQKPLLAYSEEPSHSTVGARTSKRIPEAGGGRDRKDQILQLIEDWKSAWSQKRMDLYMRFYAPDFYAQGMDREAWRRKKTRLSRLYDYINIDVKDVRLFFYGDKVLARFLQRYQGDQYVDFGMKSLWLKETNGIWRIFREEWKPIEPQRFAAIETPLHPEGKIKERSGLHKGLSEAASKKPKSRGLQGEHTLGLDQKDRIMQFLKEWKVAWEQKQLDRYLSFYSKDFRVNGFDWQDWKRHKKNILLKYLRIRVQIESVHIEPYDGGARVTFLQNFQGDGYQDIGIKRLFLKMSEGSWKITREEWKAL